MAAITVRQKGMEKKEIIEILRPIAALEPLTPEAVSAVPQELIVSTFVPIRQFPFRIGRESRVQMVGGSLHRVERPKSKQQKPNNDLYLIDRGVLFNISREHLQLERGNGDSYLLVDRGSASGTKVNDVPIGGNDAGGSGDLQDGDEIRIGSKSSPYLFRFITLT